MFFSIDDLVNCQYIQGMENILKIARGTDLTSEDFQKLREAGKVIEITKDSDIPDLRMDIFDEMKWRERPPVSFDRTSTSPGATAPMKRGKRR